MRLNSQKIIVIAFTAIILVALGVMIFTSSKLNDHKQIAMPVIATTTKASDLNSNGWWNSIPTQSSMPTMPGANNKATLLITPISSP
jgi:hypothetical protein